MKNLGLYVVLAAFIIVIGVIIFLAVRRREEVFEGEVIDKNIIESQVMNNGISNPGIGAGGIMIGNSGGLRHTYKIMVKTDQGKTINYTISSGMYEIIKIGDRVSKPKGSTEITIISSNNSNTPTPTSNNSAASPMPTNLNPPESIS